MSPVSASEPRSWWAGRWGGLILLVLGLQVGLLFWLSDRKPLPRRAEVHVPVLRPAGALSAEFLAVSDPTWFTLPHAEGISGRTWLQAPQPAFHAFTWTNPPAWLRLPQEQPGAAIYAFVRSNDFGAAVPAAAAELVWTLPEPVPLPLAGERSELRLEGGLAHRALLTRVELTNQPSAGLLTNSVVQTLVDAKGWPQTVTLLKSSGAVSADQEALARAAVLRFAPLPAEAATNQHFPALLTEGVLVFVWHTVPDPTTNTAAAPPP